MALTANLLRLANSADSGLPSGITTIRAAILRLGHRAVRSVAVSLTIQSLLSGDGANGTFSPARYTKHSIAVGFLARYVFARKKQKEAIETRFSPDEVFAAGLLHDLGHALLSRVAPGVYSMLANASETKGIAIANEFENLYGQSLGSLGADAARTWNLPKIFIPAIEFVESPCEAEDELTAIYCIHYADQLVKQADLTIEPWAQQPQPDPLVLAEVALPDEEIEGALQIIQGQTESYLQTAGCAAA